MGLPYPVAKYGGSILWAGMVYFGLRALFPSPRAVRVAVFAAILTALGELTQLVSMPGFDELRATPIGHLMFGRTFDWPDIAAYWIGIGLAAAGDALVLRSHK